MKRSIFSGGDGTELELTEIGDWVLVGGKLTKLEEAKEAIEEPDELEPMSPADIIRYILIASKGEAIEL